MNKKLNSQPSGSMKRFFKNPYVGYCLFGVFLLLFPLASSLAYSSLFTLHDLAELFVLERPELVVDALAFHQLIGGAHFGQLAVVDGHDVVAVAEGGEAVGDGEDRKSVV